MNKLYKLFILFFFHQSVYSQSITISLRDSITSEPIKLAHVLLGNHPISISNEDGKLIIDESHINTEDSLLITHINYVTLKVPASSLSHDQAIQLKPKSYVLEEISIYDTKSILEKVSDHLQSNYINFPCKESFFIRTTLLKNEQLEQFSEGFLDVYRSKYFDRSPQKEMDIRLTASKKVNILEEVKFKHFSIDYLFDLSEAFIPLIEKDYHFTFNEIDENLLSIDFKPKTSSKKNCCIRGI